MLREVYSTQKLLAEQQLRFNVVTKVIEGLPKILQRPEKPRLQLVLVN